MFEKNALRSLRAIHCTVHHFEQTLALGVALLPAGAALQPKVEIPLCLAVLFGGTAESFDAQAG
jgi:hypothetical protein